MSMINDALRRASSASRGVAEPPPLPLVIAAPPPIAEAPIPITEDMLAQPPPPHPMLNADGGFPPLIAPDLGGNNGEKSGSKKGMIIGLVFVFGVAAACGFSVWRKHRAAQMQIIAKTEKKPVHPIAAVPQALSNMQAKIESRSPVSEPINKTLPSTSAVVPAPAPVAQSKPPVTPASVANSTPVKFPPLRLQSIFYRPSNPSVMINGKLLCISDEIQGVLVADIQPSSVTLVLSGYTNVLTLR